MVTGGRQTGNQRAVGPWFQQRPRLALAIAAVLYVVVFVLRVSIVNAGDPISHLAVLPIALIAVTFGVVPGLLAGAVGVGVVAGWVLIDNVSISAVGWITRVTPLFLVGGLIGAAADGLREVQETQRQLDAAELRRREAAEVHDTIVQGLAVAKWMLEAGMHERGLEVLTETMVMAQALVAELLDGDPHVAGAFRRQEAARPT